MTQHKYDVVIATDLRLPGGSSSSTVEEIKSQHAAGYKTGLLHIPNSAMQNTRPFNKKIQDCIRLDYAYLIPTDSSFKAKLLLIRNPSGVEHFSSNNNDYDVSHCLIVANHVPHDENGIYYNVLELDKKAKEKFSSYEWAPISPLVRELIDIHKEHIPVREKDWVNIINVDQWIKPRHRPAGKHPVIGRISRDQYMKWPANTEDILAAYPKDDKIKVRILGGASLAESILGQIPENWTVLSYDTYAAQNFLGSIDFFVYFHHPGLKEAFGRAILEALASGAVVILPKHFEPLFKDSCIYSEPSDVSYIVSRLHTNWDKYKKQSKKGLSFIKNNFSYSVHTTRLEHIVGKPTKQKPKRKYLQPVRSINKKKIVLFMSSNGAGVGHLTRLMSLARRSSDNIQPVFFTLSQAVGVVEKHGFTTEYLGSPSYLGMGSMGAWSAMLEHRLEILSKLYQPDILVFDGPVPYEGLLDFISNHPEIKSVWSRRAMWKNIKSHTADNLGEISRKFTLVVEPGDISESLDDGPTVAERKNVFHVDPVTLLDKDELLSKKEARKILGLDQDKIIGLIQLGAGNINDTSSILNNILSVYKDIPELDICVTKSVIANKADSLEFNNVIGISHYPLSECLNAFDFAIGAAGYNSFHEFINFGVPTLIVPNTHANIDSALNRSSYAESKGAILVAREEDTEEIKVKAKQLLDAGLRDRLKQNAEKLYRPNGAKDAMKKIESLLEGDV